jgi:hypothetical protein
MGQFLTAIDHCLGTLAVLLVFICLLLALSGCATTPIRQCDGVPFFEAGCW